MLESAEFWVEAREPLSPVLDSLPSWRRVSHTSSPQPCCFREHTSTRRWMSRLQQNARD